MELYIPNQKFPIFINIINIKKKIPYIQTIDFNLLRIYKVISITPQQHFFHLQFYPFHQDQVHNIFHLPNNLQVVYHIFLKAIYKINIKVHK